MNLKPAKVKQIRRHIYLADGRAIWVGPKHHKRIQEGGMIVSKETGRRILPSMFQETVVVG